MLLTAPHVVGRPSLWMAIQNCLTAASTANMPVVWEIGAAGGVAAFGYDSKGKYNNANGHGRIFLERAGEVEAQRR